MIDIHRWDRVERPDAKTALLSLARRVLPWAVLAWGVLMGVGWLIVKGPLAGVINREGALNTELAEDRTGLWNRITMYMSHIGNTEYVIAVAVLVALILWWRTRRWWYAVVPIIAISFQATTFVLSTNLIGRARPEVTHLDPAPPTSSFPSGHVGAATALYVTFALMAQRIAHPVWRRLVTVLLVLVPVVVAYARLYRGMHHPIDVAFGALNGLAGAAVAWTWLATPESVAHGIPGDAHAEEAA